MKTLADEIDGVLSEYVIAVKESDGIKGGSWVKPKLKTALLTLIQSKQMSVEEINDVLRTIPGSECWVGMIVDNRIAQAIHREMEKRRG